MMSQFEDEVNRKLAQGCAYHSIGTREEIEALQACLTGLGLTCAAVQSGIRVEGAPQPVFHLDLLTGVGLHYYVMLLANQDLTMAKLVEVRLGSPWEPPSAHTGNDATVAARA